MFVLYSPSNPSLELLFLQDKVVQSRAATVALTVSWSWVVTSSETQGQSVGPGEKAQRKFSNTGGRAPGYLLSPDHFQTVKRMLAPGWAQKMLCIVVPNRRTISPEFFSWVRTRQLLFQSRLVLLMHQRNARSQETFSLIFGTQGLFHPYFKTFVTPFLPTLLTAPGSPRMAVVYDKIIFSVVTVRLFRGSTFLEI